MTSTAPYQALLQRETIEHVIDGPPVINHSEAWGHLITVVVAGGPRGAHTIATHMIVSGSGDRLSKDRRRVEMIGIPLYTTSSAWITLASTVARYIEGLPNVTVAIENKGNGTEFRHRLSKLAPTARCVSIQWGDVPVCPAYAARFSNARAQAYVHAAEAIKDRAIRLTSAMADTILCQGSDLAYTFDHRGAYRLESEIEQYIAGIDQPAVWDSIAMAYVEGLDYLPAIEQTSAADAWGLDLERIGKDAERGIGASSGDTLRLLTEVLELRKLKAEFAAVESRSL